LTIDDERSSPVLEVHAVEVTQTQQIELEGLEDLKDLRDLVIRLLDGDLICRLDTKVELYKGNNGNNVTK
jgi:hypothetical protein